MATKKTTANLKNTDVKDKAVTHRNNLPGAGKQEPATKRVEKKSSEKQLKQDEKKQHVSPEAKTLKTSSTKTVKTAKPKSDTDVKVSNKAGKKPVKTGASERNRTEIIPSVKNSKAGIKTALRIIFQLRFTSQYGQTLFITGNHPVLGDNEVATALPMQYLNHEFWYASINLPNAKGLKEKITYRYFIKDHDGNISMEWGDDKYIKMPATPLEELLIADSWNYAGYYENVFYTVPFKNVLFRRDATIKPVQQKSPFTHIFKIKAPLLSENQRVFLSGSIPELGGWDTGEVVIMSRNENDDWYTVNINLSDAVFPISYKYGIYDTEKNTISRFEEGPNRVFYDMVSQKKITVLADGFIRLPNNSFKGAGVAIPVFSLRSGNGLGVGEFADLKLLVDWAKNVGLKLIQVLPVNDTSATHTNADSYPYAAISAFALHPIYLHLPAIVNEENHHILLSINDQKERLNAADGVKYAEVMKTKLSFIKKIFPLQKHATFSTVDFNTFFTTNAHWLVPYAAFCYLRDKYGTAEYDQWLLYSSYDVFEINNLATPVLTAIDEISIHYFIQYHLHLQLKSAKEYAHANGVIVKGDIPIGIFRHSCDAWQQPHLYNMDMQAGAPPDDFAVKGQNWGFPTYNWQRMAEDGFRWWKKRFEQMSHYFDAFRIDHILGFFRIWSIPIHAVEGILGHFVPSIPVHINEIHEQGIPFEHYRYTKPFINDIVLGEEFGSDADYVKETYVEKKLENYELLPAFDTQQKVEAHFALLEESIFNNKIKQGLFDLIANIILIDVEGSQGQQYHFRFGIENTSSFRFLDEGTREKLKRLYINYFYRRQDDFWMKEAMQKLPELKRSTNMLICGEDLGMVPACVPGVMKDLGILSLEIQRMPKDPLTEFFNPNEAPYLSVVTPSTHDMSTIRGWWEEDRSKTQRFYNQQLGQPGNAPFFCEPWINKAIVLQHLYSPAMWCILQLQDILGMSGTLRRQNPSHERINIPSNPKHYWQYRMHIQLEKLTAEKNFTNEVTEYIKMSGR